MKSTLGEVLPGKLRRFVCPLWWEGLGFSVVMTSGIAISGIGVFPPLTRAGLWVSALCPVACSWERGWEAHAPFGIWWYAHVCLGWMPVEGHRAVRFRHIPVFCTHLALLGWQHRMCQLLDGNVLTTKPGCSIQRAQVASARSPLSFFPVAFPAFLGSCLTICLL